VLSAFNVVISFASLIGLGLAGLVGDLIGVAPIFVISGAGMSFVFILAYFFPNISKLDKVGEPEPEDE
jgi:dipeptide/tripeptide permease